MNKALFSLPALLALLIPFAASAHEHATYDIGGLQYDFTIGSLNEPVAVDDKTGVDLRVARGGRIIETAGGDAEYVGGTPATGLENDLTVELIAGDKKKTLALSPVFNAPGSYTASYYPTVATTIAYRIVGTVGGTPVDLVFPCLAEGATAPEEGEKQLSSDVVELRRSGSFGCPAPKEGLGFPEASGSIETLARDAARAHTVALGGLAAGVAGIALAGFALARRRS